MSLFFRLGQSMAIFALLVVATAWAPQDREVVASGVFVKKSKSIKGSFSISKVDGKLVLQLGSDFKTKSGPDLQIIFSPHPIADVDKNNAAGANTLTIGLLERTKGEQTYELPADFDLSTFKSVLIHCVKYSVLWGGGALD